jgi:hypothetical protein
VLAAKPDQGHVHWTKYVFRLCVSYRLLNTVTRGFEFPVPRCDDAVNDIGPREFTITGDLKAGCWQVIEYTTYQERNIIIRARREETLKQDADGDTQRTRFLCRHDIKNEKIMDGKIQNETGAETIHHIIMLSVKYNPSGILW